MKTISVLNQTPVEVANVSRHLGKVRLVTPRNKQLQTIHSHQGLRFFRI